MMDTFRSDLPPKRGPKTLIGRLSQQNIRMRMLKGDRILQIIGLPQGIRPTRQRQT